MQEGAPDVRRTAPSGQALHVLEVVHELRHLGHEVGLLARLGGKLCYSGDEGVFTPVRVPMDEGARRLLEKVTRRLQTELRLPYLALFESFRFAQACRRVFPQCDVFYERAGWMGYGGAIAARAQGIPRVLEMNGDHPDELRMRGIAPRGAQRIASMVAMRFAARKASHVVATGEGWRRRAIDRWGVSPSEISVVENGSAIVGLLRRDQLRSFRPDDTDDEPVTLAYVGAFDPWQGLQVLLEAVARAVAHGADIRLSMFGSGGERSAVLQAIDGLGLGERVHLPGHLPVEELAAELSRSDIGVSAYHGRVEFSGLKLLDYKSAGLATIASGEGGEPVVIQDGHTGYVVRPGDAEGFCEAIMRLAADARVRKAMGRAARLEAEQFHTWARTATRLAEICAMAIERAKVAC